MQPPKCSDLCMVCYTSGTTGRQKDVHYILQIEKVGSEVHTAMRLQVGTLY